jgi:hypothetical protein
MSHLDPNSIGGLERAGQRIPVTVDAQKEVRYFSASNQVVIDGNCVVTATKADPNGTTEYVLMMPKLTLDLIEDPNAGRKDAGAASRTWGPAVQVQHVTASGESVTLQILSKTALGLVGWVELQGRQLDYDRLQNHFTTIGPGQINLYTSQTAGAKKDSSEIGFRQPCYIFLRDFDSLTYSAVSNRVVAESKDRQLQVDYFPLVNGRTDRHIEADVGHIEAELTHAADNRMELASLTASQGIVFQEKDPANQFQFDGSTLFYNHRTSLMTIRGDTNTPCYFNGSIVEEIEMDVKTLRSKATVIAPSTFRVNKEPAIGADSADRSMRSGIAAHRISIFRMYFLIRRRRIMDRWVDA